MKIVSKNVDPSDQSAKFIFSTSHGHTVEGVYLPDPRFYGFCASTQVGCNMGCKFCATGLERNKYNLGWAEIVEQVDLMNERIQSELPFDFVTLSGMGEPLANYTNSTRALEILREKYSSLTVVSLSTVGLTKGIRRLTTERRSLRLYVSLHATNDETRRKLIPIASQYPMEELLAAVTEFGELNGPEACRVSYLLLKGINDTPRDLEKLAQLFANRPVMLQILLWNEVHGLGFKRVDDATANEWRDYLRDKGVNAYVMRSMGRRIDAACGQLQSRMRQVLQ